MYCALGTWRWLTSPVPHWEGPQGALDALDLRPLPAQGTAGGPGGWGLWWFLQDPTLTPGVVAVLGNDPAGRVSEAAILVAQASLGFVISARRLDAVTRELLTDHSDPAGQNFAKPLMPGTLGRNLRLKFGPIDLSESFDIRDHRHKDKVIQVLQRDYAIRRAFDVPRGSVQFLKILGALMRKYPGLDYRQVQGDLPDEPPIEPSTTISENFNTADSDTLGPQLSWTEIAGDIDVVSNQAQLAATARAHARADSDLSSDDHYALATCTAGSPSSGFLDGGVSVRFGSDATNYNLTYASFFGGIIIIRYNAGAQTLLTAADAQAATNGTELRIEADGSTIRGYYAGALRLEVTDTDITGNVRAGLVGQRDDLGGDPTFWDDFQAADLNELALGAGNRNPMLAHVGHLMVR